jgi:hypothetical protein
LGGALLPNPAPDKTQQRAMNMCDVLEVFAKKVCKTTNDGSIHVNILVYISKLHMPEKTLVDTVEAIDVVEHL